MNSTTQRQDHEPTVPRRLGSICPMGGQHQGSIMTQRAAFSWFRATRLIALHLIGILWAVAAESRVLGEIAASAVEPPIVFSVQPMENNHLVYMRVTPETANLPPSNLLGLFLKVVNNGDEEIRLNSIRVRFSGNSAPSETFSRDILFDPGQTKSVNLSPDESIRLPQPAPSTAFIDLFFEGYRQPKTVQRALAPYFSSASSGIYLFPGNGKDLEPDQYFTNKDRHTGGSQFFGYDLVVHGWDPFANAFRSVKSGGSSKTNEDRLGWNIPIYAMADGVVIRASTGWEDNPAPGTRSIQRMGADHTSDHITDVKVTRFGDDRAATVVRRTSGALEVTVWDTEDNGREVYRRGSALGEEVLDIAADALTGSRLVSAVRTETGNLRVIVWGISADGETVTRLSERDAGKVKEVSLTKISTRRFATAVRTQQNALRLIVWEVSADGSSIALLSHAFAGDATSISTIALSSSRLVTCLRTAGGVMKAIVWDLLNDATTIQRRGDATSAHVLQTVAVRNSSTGFVTTMRLSDETLKLVRWDVSESGMSLTPDLEQEAGVIQDLEAVRSFDGTILTAVITQQGTFKNIFWLPDEDNGTYKRWGEREAGLPMSSVLINSIPDYSSRRCER